MLTDAPRALGLFLPSAVLARLLGSLHVSWTTSFASKVIDLVLSIASTIGVAVVLRMARQYDRNIEIVIAANYVIAAAIGLLLALATDKLASVEPLTAVLGFIGGLIWPTAFHLYASGIATFGMARTGAWARLSLAVPVLLGLVFFGEALTPRLAIGLALLFGAFLLLTPRLAPVSELRPPDRRAPKVLLYAGTLIITFGVIDAWVSLFNEVASGEDDLAFFVVLFGTAAAVSTTMALKRGNSFTRVDSLTGVALGILNFSVSYFLLRALAGGFEGRSALAFTLFSASSLVLMALIGRLAWGEQVKGREVAGIATAMVAIIALNL